MCGSRLDCKDCTPRSTHLRGNAILHENSDYMRIALFRLCVVMEGTCRQNALFAFATNGG
jgi:hypothetical protein